MGPLSPVRPTPAIGPVGATAPDPAPIPAAPVGPPNAEPVELSGWLPDEPTRGTVSPPGCDAGPPRPSAAADRPGARPTGPTVDPHPTAVSNTATVADDQARRRCTAPLPACARWHICPSILCQLEQDKSGCARERRERGTPVSLVAPRQAPA